MDNAQVIARDGSWFLFVDWQGTRARLRPRNSGFWAQYNSTDAARCTVSSDVDAVTLRMLVEAIS